MVISFVQLDRKEKQRFKKLLYGGFEIQNEASMNRLPHKIDPMLHTEGSSNDVFNAALRINCIIASADSSFFTFAGQEMRCKKCMEEIAMNEMNDSWEIFPHIFIERECINNTLERKIHLIRSIRKQPHKSSLIENSKIPANITKRETTVILMGIAISFFYFGANYLNIDTQVKLYSLENTQVLLP